MKSAPLPKGTDEISTSIRYLAARIEELDSRTIGMVPLGPCRESQERFEEERREAIAKTVTKLSEEIPSVDRSAQELVCGMPVPEDGSHTELKQNGQQKDYVVLSAEERTKGFVRPVRSSYKHVGLAAPRYPLRDLTPDEHEQYDKYGYVKYEEYPADSEEGCGMFWTQEKLSMVNNGCGQTTTMGRALAETYARDPHFYGGTFCVGCGTHLPVGKHGEFTWSGTNERVGT